MTEYPVSEKSIYFIIHHHLHMSRRWLEKHVVDPDSDSDCQEAVTWSIFPIPIRYRYYLQPNRWIFSRVV